MRHVAELTGTPLTGPALTGPALTGPVAAVAARAAYAALRRKPPAGEPTWTRTNHRGEPVTLLEGPAVALGAITAQVVAAAAAHDPERSRDFASPLAVSLAGAGALGFGLLDDLKGSGKRRGLRGHLGALAHGEITTGTVKLAGLAATGLVAAPPGEGAIDRVINAGLIAGGANLLNLFDLRPGRAIKVATLSAGLIAGGSALAGSGAGARAVAAPLGAGLALLPEDLGERAMLGDAGANALGAMLGAAAATSLPRKARAALLAGIVALTVASEKISFTKVIQRTPALNWLDMLGRVPPGGTTTPLPPPRGETAHPTIPPGPGRRPAGRHRRVRNTDTSVRSVEWVSGLFKTVARQEP